MKFTCSSWHICVLRVSLAMALCLSHLIQISINADERKEPMNSNGWRFDESKPRTHHCVNRDTFMNIILLNVATITVYFIRPIRDLVLCERFAVFIPLYFYVAKKRHRRFLFSVVVRVYLFLFIFFSDQFSAVTSE